MCIYTFLKTEVYAMGNGIEHNVLGIGTKYKKITVG